jgi:hypothetical protein
MSLPANFSEQPAEDPHKYFRNILIQFRKTIKSSKDADLLQDQMAQFIDASRQMNWHHKQSGVYHKDQGEKAADKVWTEFKRYAQDLQMHPHQANPQDLLEALGEIERLVNSLKVT